MYIPLILLNAAVCSAGLKRKSIVSAVTDTDVTTVIDVADTDSYYDSYNHNIIDTSSLGPSWAILRPSWAVVGSS